MAHARRRPATVSEVKASQLVVWPAAEQYLVPARELAAQLALPLCTDPASVANASLLLQLGAHGLSLKRVGPRAPGPVRVQFDHPGMRHRRRSGQNELLGRAIGVHRWLGMRVVDTTAGLGSDAFVLADLGARVLLCERHPVLAMMLEEAVHRCGSSDDDWLRTVAGRLQVWHGDARRLQPHMLQGVDALYLDPMFPHGGRKAAPAKEMSVLQHVLGEQDPQADAALLVWALQQPVRRVVVKRPLKAPPLGQSAPHHTIRGRSVRFDVYQPPAASTAVGETVEMATGAAC